MVEPPSQRHVGPMDLVSRSRTSTGPHRGSHLAAVIGRFLFRLLVTAMAAMLASGVGHAMASPVVRGAAERDDDVATAIRERNGAPAGFETELGYSPIARDGLLLDPDGGCSTPGHIGPRSFETACQAHDFGYDVLRFAAATGHRPDPSARLEADRLLYRDAVDTCTTFGCEATAALYFAAVSANSVRQGYQAPSEEPTIPWALLGIGVLLVAWLDSSRLRGLARRLESALPRERVSRVASPADSAV